MKGFSDDVHFQGHVKPGKQAIKNEHRPLIIETEAHKAVASLNFDEATLNVFKDHKSWDYFIEISGQSEALHAIEVHHFDRSALRGKKAGTLKVLEKHCPAAEKAIRSWNVILKGEGRSDLVKRFSAETKIRFYRTLRLSDIKSP